MSTIRILLVGESWVSVTTHHKGFDQFASGLYGTGASYIEEALKADELFEYSHLPGHLVSEEFPNTLEELSQWDVIILSDIGSNSLLLSNKVFIEGVVQPNRLQLLRKWVGKGGSLCMCGGYLSFSGFQGGAKYYRTPIEEALPVDIYTFDDRIETPEGTTAIVVAPDHPILEGVCQPWPVLLGYQEVVLKKGATLIVESQYKHPLLAVMEYGKGRSMVWTSDIGPHWCPKEFTQWYGYGKMWRNAMRWLANRE